MSNPLEDSLKKTDAI